jgi:hypothetical protein
MSERDLAPLDPAVRAVLDRAARARPGTTPEARARVLARVEGVVGPLGGGPSGGSGGHTHRAAPGPVGGAAALGRLLPLVASFVVGGAAGAVGVYSLRPATVERVVYVERPEPAASSVASAEPPRREPPAVPRASSEPAPAARQSTAPAPPANAESGSTLAAERQLLDVARRAVTEEDGAAALAAVTEHERRYPNGLLVQEREVMAVHALALLGRSEDARARADRFRSRFPTSLLLPALESAVRSLPTQ